MPLSKAKRTFLNALLDRLPGVSHHQRTMILARDWQALTKAVRSALAEIDVLRAEIAKLRHQNEDKPA